MHTASVFGSEEFRDRVWEQQDEQHARHREMWSEAAEMLDNMDWYGRITMQCDDYIVRRDKITEELVDPNQDFSATDTTECSPAFVLAASAGVDLEGLNGEHVSVIAEELYYAYGMKEKASIAAVSLPSLPIEYRTAKTLADVWKSCAVNVKHPTRSESGNYLPKRYIEKSAKSLAKKAGKAERRKAKRQAKEPAWADLV